MFSFLFEIFKRVIGIKNKSSQEKTKPKYKTIQYKSQKVAFKYCFTAVFLLAMQVIVATFGSLHFVFPDLPSPVPFNNGRAVHLNFSLFWPVLGIMGGIYYVVPEQLKVELYSTRIANFQYWAFLFTFFSIIGSISLGITEGREYLEAIRPFDLALTGVLILFAYNIFRTLLKKKANTWTPTMIGLLVGLIFSIIFYAPSLFNYNNIVIDETTKFWIVHIWVESILELIVASVIAAIIIEMTDVNRKTVERWYYIEAFLALLTGLLGTGHHYFWIGLQPFWLYVGAIFGGLQPLPIVIIVYSTWTATRKRKKFLTNPLAFYYLWAAVLWNLVGAGFIGLLMTFPFINAYTHGTHLTSAHAHAALFGTYGFLALAIAYFVLPQWKKKNYKKNKSGLIAFILLNSGLLLMTIFMMIAGGLQAYLGRLIGLDFLTVNSLLYPYMVGRLIGGVCFSLGGFLVGWDVFRKYVFPKVV